MAMAALSPSSIQADPSEVNPKVKGDLLSSPSQIAEDARKVSKTVQTDTVTISAQALKMADDEDAVAREAAGKEARQKADNSESAARTEAQKNALKAYSAMISNQ